MVETLQDSLERIRKALEAHPDLVVYSRSMGCWKMPGAFEASTAREAIDTVREDLARATGAGK